MSHHTYYPIHWVTTAKHFTNILSVLFLMATGCGFLGQLLILYDGLDSDHYDICLSNFSWIVNQNCQCVRPILLAVGECPWPPFVYTSWQEWATAVPAVLTGNRRVVLVLGKESNLSRFMRPAPWG